MRCSIGWCVKIKSYSMENSIIIHEVEQGSDAWHDLRAGRITASKFKDMMSGLDTAGYKGLIYTAVGEILSGEVEQSYQSDAMQRGIDLEPLAREFYEEIHGVDVTEWGFVTNEEIHEQFIGVSPDGKIEGENGIIEIKCPLMKTHVDYVLKDVLPNVYKWQVQGQLLITGAEYCDFMSYYPGITPFIKRITPDPEMHEKLLERMESSVNQIKNLVEIIQNR